MICSATRMAARVAIALATTSKSGRDAQAWLSEWAWEGATEFVDRYERFAGSTPALSSEPKQAPGEIQEEVERAYRGLCMQTEQGFVNLRLAEYAEFWQVIQTSLLDLSDDGIVQETLARLIPLVLAEPLASYREVALLTLAQVCVLILEPAQFRRQMRTVLSSILDFAVPDFAFELPAVLLTEMQRRNLPAPELEGYLDRAAASEDGWGNAFRVLLARAAASSLSGQEAEALRLLEETLWVSPGCAYHTCMHLMAFANRWQAADTPSLAQVEATFPDLAFPLATSRVPGLRSLPLVRQTDLSALMKMISRVWCYWACRLADHRTPHSPG